MPGALGHDIVAHAPSGLHVALQLQLLAQDRLPHAPTSVHVCVHLPVLQVSEPHAMRPPEQLALHAPAPLHEIAPQAPLPVHVASQLPVEHEMSPHALPALPVVEHATVQLAGPHVTSPQA